ncbi:hypothetical protein P9J64_05060 [Deltaproteobacteria bacterium IMCC39524]|nr:hypothetical protein [Deltaproteobacteria bacterium IMCC39524]
MKISHWNKFSLAGPSSLGNFLAIIPILTFLYLVSKLIINLDRGLDITDESLYLLSAGSPSTLVASVSQFGFYTGILYSLVDGDLDSFRLLGLLLLIIITTLYSIILEFVFFEDLVTRDGLLIKFSRICTTLLAALCFYAWWLPTPGYNWLALVSCLLAYSGLLLTTLLNTSVTDRTTQRGQLFFCGSIVFGLSVGLAFMAKPTTSAMLSVVGFVWVLSSSNRKRIFRFVVISGISLISFFCLHILFFEQGLSTFIIKIQNGLDLIHIIGGGNDFGSLVSRSFADIMSIPFRIYKIHGMWWGILALIVLVICLIPERFRNSVKDFSIVCIFVFVWWGGLQADFWSGGVDYGRYLGIAGILLVLTTVVSVALYSIRGYPNIQICKSYSINLIWVITCIMLGPFAYAFGSNTGLLRHASGGFVFFVSAALCLTLIVGKMNSRSVVSQVYCCVVAVSVLLIFQGAFSNPYRCAPIVEQTEMVTVGRAASVIYVDSSTSNYVNTLKEVAQSSGWVIDTPLIDLTGGSPGAAYILGAMTPGAPWLIGGYPGSNAYVGSLLSFVANEVLERAWVLTSPQGRRHVSESILNDFNIHFSEDYIYIGEVISPLRKEVQCLYRPKLNM